MTRPDMLVRLNLGCGVDVVPGWINIDRSPGVLLSRLPSSMRNAFRVLHLVPAQQAAVAWPDGVRHLDVTKGLPFPDGIAEAIYSSHMLEHLPRDAADFVLKECTRVLYPGGVLRLALPDLRMLAERYVSSGDPAAADTFVEQTLMGQTTSPRGGARVIEKFGSPAHKWMYDAASLEHRLETHGFSNIEECKFGEGRCPDVEALDLPNRRDESFYIEATFLRDPVFV